MKVDKLHIRTRFKNLENVIVDFDEDHLMTVIVGRNGSGKSNVLEALVFIFRNLDLGDPPPFSYELVYRLGQKKSDLWQEVTIDADPSRGGTLAKQYEVRVRDLNVSQTVKLPDELPAGQPVPFSKVKRDKSGNALYLPKYVFAYYSGPSDRLEKYFQKHRTDFYRKLLRDEVDLKGDTHLNPSWAVKYLKFLRDFVPSHETSHVLMVTHHPLAIAELQKQQVQVMWMEDDHQVHASEPDESPRGMGINLILRSDMFGLKTTLDDDTNQKLTVRNALAAKEKLSKESIVREEGKPPETEVEYLKRLNEELDVLGFNMATDDPDYFDFLRARYHQQAKESD